MREISSHFSTQALINNIFDHANAWPRLEPQGQACNNPASAGRDVSFLPQLPTRIQQLATRTSDDVHRYVFDVFYCLGIGRLWPSSENGTAVAS